jgi:hypothetical protein
MFKHYLARFSLLAILWNIIAFAQFMWSGIQLPDANVKKSNKDDEERD